MPKRDPIPLSAATLMMACASFQSRYPDEWACIRTFPLEAGLSVMIEKLGGDLEWLQLANLRLEN